MIEYGKDLKLNTISKEYLNIIVSIVIALCALCFVCVCVNETVLHWFLFFLCSCLENANQSNS